MRASKACMNPSADRGGVSRPSKKAWTKTRGACSRAHSLTSAFR
jgi:hypothetical protein